jgi:hypothetical protein
MTSRWSKSSRLCSSKELSNGKPNSRAEEHYSSNVLLNQTRGLLNKERSGFGVSAFGISK